MAKEYLTRLLEQLQATKEGLADPRPIVAEWVDQFTELLGHVDTEDEQIAFDFVAAWARLHRTSPRVLAEVCDAEPAAAAGRADAFLQLLSLPDDKREKIQQRMPKLLNLALDVPRPLDWIQELFEYRARSDQGLEPEQAAAWAIDLLTDLDDVDLSLWAAGKHCPSHPRVGSIKLPLRLAHRALQENAELFLPASVWVQAFLKAANLELEDADLANTLDKFVPIVEELARFEQQLQTAPKVPESILQRLIDETSRRHLTSSMDVLRESVELLYSLQPHYAMAADARKEAYSLEIIKWYWTSPDNKYIARFELPPQIDSSNAPEQLTIAIKLIAKQIKGIGPLPGNPASELAGTEIQLAGVTSTIDTSGLAAFPLELLKNKLQTAPDTQLPVLRLRIGSNWVEWRLASAANEDNQEAAK